MCPNYISFFCRSQIISSLQNKKYWTNSGDKTIKGLYIIISTDLSTT